MSIEVSPGINAEKKSREKISPDWWTKTIVGCVLGATLALALGGLFAWLGPGGITADNKVQFIMWLLSPLWMLIFSVTFLFRTGLRALLWLAAANLLAYGILLAAQQVLSGQ